MGETIDHSAGVADLTAEQARRRLSLLLAAGLLLRLALCCWFQARPLMVWDERDYHALAVNLVKHGEYAFEPGEPTSLRPPLYPFLLAGVYRCIGLDYPTQAQHAVRLAQALLGLLTVLLVYAIGKEVYNRRTGLWAASFLCFYPSLVGTANLLLTETVFTLVLCGAALVLVKLVRNGALVWAVLAGLLIGVGALTRSVLWLLPPFVAIYLLIALNASFVRRLAAGLTLLAAFAATVAPWVIRNTRLQQTFVAIDTMGGRNFMMANYEHTPLYRAWAAIDVKGDEAWDRVLAARHPDWDRLTQGQRDKVALREGLRFAVEHPGLTLQRDVIRFFNFWQLERELVAGAQRGFWGEWPEPAVLALAGVICGAYALAVLGGLFGMVLTPPAWRFHLLLLLLIAYVNGMHVLTFAHSRYHLPLMPLVLLYTSAAFTKSGAVWRQKGRPAFWFAAALSAVLAGSWLWQIHIDFGR